MQLIDMADKLDKLADKMNNSLTAFLQGWKVMRVSKIAKGRRAKSLVFRGKKPKVKTVGGLTKRDLKKNTQRKIVDTNGKKASKYVKSW